MILSSQVDPGGSPVPPWSSPQQSDCAPLLLIPAGGSWWQSCAPLVLTGPVGTANLFAASCGLQSSAPSWINLAMCAPNAIMANSKGVLVCSAITPGIPGG